MFKWEHEYTDLNGNKRQEVFLFRFSKAELLDLEWRTPGGLENYMKSIISKQDGQALADMFKMLIEASYGVKSPDGRSFIKKPEVLEQFKYTDAYDDLYMLLAKDDKFAAEFVNGIFPKEAVEEAKRQKEMAEKAGVALVNMEAAPVPKPQAETQQVGIPVAAPVPKPQADSSPYMPATF